MLVSSCWLDDKVEVLLYLVLDMNLELGLEVEMTEEPFEPSNIMG